MTVKIAVITGASAGLGREFVSQLEENFPSVEQVWLVARSEDKLKTAAQSLKKTQVRFFPLDLCSGDSLAALEAAFAAERPEIRLLVNNAGCGYLGNVGETELAEQTRMVDLNVRALTAVTALAVPYMSEGGRIINLSSIASFCPNARMTVYSATKSYVAFFSRGLGLELKPKGITVTAVCPGPMATEFLDVGHIAGRSKMFEMLPYCDPVKVVAGSYAAARAGRPVYTPKGFFKFYRVVAKIVPQRLMALFAKT